MKTIGFVLNPIAGMGGAVGLKGTDGVTQDAINRGAQPQAHKRAQEAFKNIPITFLTCSHPMGQNCCDNHQIIYTPPPVTSSQDTRKACERMIEEQVDLVVFCGGDGTARDVYDTVGQKVPILGVPAGVKMYSSVFAITPRAAGEILTEFLQGNTVDRETEIMDINEKDFRHHSLNICLHGYARTPSQKTLLQMGKIIVSSLQELQHKQSIASFIAPLCKKGTVILGGGSTVDAIAQHLGVQKSTLGIDVLHNGEVHVQDATEQDILSSLNGEQARIIISPMGQQGFIFGRGNQPISPTVIRQVGASNIIIVSTPTKMIHTPSLFVDTGDPSLDHQLSGWTQVITGYAMAIRKKVKSYT